MPDVKLCAAGGKARLAELLESWQSSARGRDEERPRISELVRSPAGDRRAELYSSMADDASVSEQKREAAMLFSAAELLLEDGETKQCLKVAGDALLKFRTLGDVGGEGVVDTLHVIVDAHRLQAYMSYTDPDAALSLATGELVKFKEAGNRRGEATMLLALAEIGTDNVRHSKRCEALEPVTEALAIARELGDKRLVAKCLIESAFVHFSLYDGDKMLESAEEALAISEETMDGMGKGMALYAIALSYVRVNDWDRAMQNAALAKRVFEEAGKRCFEAGVLHTMAIWRLLDEKPKSAVPLAEQALEICKQMEKGRRAEASVTFTVCEAMADAKNTRGAIELAKVALDNFQASGSKKEQAIIQEALTFVHLASDAPDKAARTIELARQLADQLGERRYQSRILLAASAVHLRAKDKDEAFAALERAADLAHEEADLHQLAVAQRELASFYMLDREDYREAVGVANIAIDTAQQDNDRVAEAEALMQVAFCHSQLEDNEKALTACTEAQEMFQDAGCAEGEAQALWMLAELRALEGKFESAVEAAEERLPLCRRLKDQKMEAKALELLATLHMRARNHEEAERVCKEALSVAQHTEDLQIEMDITLSLVQLYLDQTPGTAAREAKVIVAKAAKAAGDAVAIATRLGEKGSRGVALYWRAQTFIMEERFQDAQRAASEAEALFKNIQSERGQGACLHLAGTLHSIFGQLDRALDTLDKALAFAQAAKDPQLEYEVSSSIYHVQSRARPAQAAAVDPLQQLMMPTEDGAVPAEAAAAGASVAPQPKGLELDFVRRQLMTFVKDVIASDEELELDSPFMEAGLDSLSSVALMSMVAKEFQMALSPSLVFDFPTVRALEEHLVEESKG